MTKKSCSFAVNRFSSIALLISLQQRTFYFAIEFDRIALLHFYFITFFTYTHYYFMNLFVAKLSPATTSEDLNDLFGEYGDVVSAKVIMDRDTGTSKLFGFVEMKEEESAQRAIKELNECLFDNSAIVVKKARPKGDDKRRSNFGGGDRSRSRSRSEY